MKMQTRYYSILVCVLILFGIPTFGQTPESSQTNQKPNTADQSPNLVSNTNSINTVANEIALLRTSLQTLNARLREISAKLLTPDSTQRRSTNDNQHPILLNLDLLTRAEQRAELLRKQLFELIEKETLLRTRLVQIDEDLRPENIERAINVVGTTRTPELRDARRRLLESDRKGVESLLSQVTQSRQRMEDDVRQADTLVSKLRQRLLPLIENEIEKININ
jgi:hypothetical protein